MDLRSRKNCLGLYILTNEYTCLLSGHSISISNGNNNSDNSFYMLHMQGIVQSLAYFSYKVSSMKIFLPVLFTVIGI